MPPARTPAAWAVAIAAAEYVAGVVPRGTHTWRKFITPDELQIMAGEQVAHMARGDGWQLGQWPADGVCLRQRTCRVGRPLLAWLLPPSH